MSFDPKKEPVLLTGTDLKLVVLECPYDTIAEPETQKLYSRLIAMKIKSYLAEYPYGANPIDSTDIFATHLLLCRSTPWGLVPLMGMKSVTLDRCQKFNCGFPASSLTKDPKNPDFSLPKHEAAVKKIIEKAVRAKESIAYNGSWAIDPSVRKDDFLKQVCRDVSVFYLIQHYLDRKIQNVLAGATHRFKVEEYKEFVGYEYLSLNGEKLEPFPCQYFFGETISIMHLRTIREEAKQWASKYAEAWKERIVIAGAGEKLERKAA